MRVELRVEARRDLIDGAWFYEQQRQGLGAYFTDRITPLVVDVVAILDCRRHPDSVSQQLRDADG